MDTLELSSVLSEALDRKIHVLGTRPVFGGDINQCFVVDSEKESFFVKTSTSVQAEHMYETEVAGLQALKTAGALCIPDPIKIANHNQNWMLVMQYIELGGNENWPEMGQQLAQLHRFTAKQYGFEHDNYIGLSVQPNTKTEDWADFWWQCRLHPQLSWAIAKGFDVLTKNSMQTLFDKVFQTLSHQPQASLVHGDLWRGNADFDQDGHPVIYDPAAYYGDREVDIAMTRLFGGFPDSFYIAYEQSLPLKPQYKMREPIYNLYHLLNHLNLFGASYLTTCVNCISRICDITPG